jgi:hypothetical protein
MIQSEEEHQRLSARIWELLKKQYSSLTEEERMRPFAQNPGWREECERRCRFNLTDDEKAELAELNRLTSEWKETQYPLPMQMLEDMERRYEEELRAFSLHESDSLE